MRLLSVENLDVFHGDFHAVRKVNLDIDEGQTVAIIGANGAGKSTLLNAITGLNTQKKGRVTFGGDDITRLRADLIARRGITMVPEGRRLFVSLSVEDNLKVGASAGRPGPWDIEAVYRLFPRLGELRKMQAGALSGGQQQMVAIGRALMARPRVLLMDEPSLGLSPRMIDEIAALIVELRASGLSIVLVEQNASLALQLSDHGYVLETGAIALEGPSRDLLTDPEVARAYLGA
jgi:branched-chain amino acid transport system ATP-binding protein